MRKTRVLILVAALLLAFGAAFRTRPRPDDTARAAAVTAFQRAQRAALDGLRGEQFHALVAAVEADPTYLPAVYELFRHTRVTTMWHEAWPIIAEVLQRMPDRASADCLRRLLHLNRMIDEPPPPFVAAAARDCAELYAVANDAKPVSDRGRRAAALWRRFPESSGLAEQVSVGFGFGGSPQSLEISAEMIRPEQHELTRLQGYAFRVRALKLLGRDSDATVAVREGDRSLRSAAQTTRAIYLWQTERLHEIDTSIVRSGDRDNQVFWTMTLATRAYDNGQLSLSHALWQQLIDRKCGAIDVCAFALMFRGRTHMKAGRLDLAERDLRAAERLVAPARDLSVQMEVDHNLFHIFEARNNVDSAMAAGRRYVKDTETPFRDVPRMMAHHDLGWYLWRVGRYEDARVMLTRMLSIIDTLDDYRHWQGEYYERTGDLGRAVEAYPRTLSDGRLDYRSIARRAALAAQLGDTAAAFDYARLHDSADQPGYPEFTPLLPALLASMNQYAQAWTAFEHAEATALARNQSAALANLKLERATLAIQLGRATAAREAADSAVLLAARVGSFETELLARQTRAFADILLDPAKPVDQLSLIPRRAIKLGMPQLEARLHVLHGDAQAARRHIDGALATYTRAAVLNDSVARSLPSDADQSLFRAFASATSNKAIHLIARHANQNKQLTSYAAWSVQRKARGIGSSRKIAQPAAGEAVIDYAITDSLVLALLLTEDTALLRVLPITPVELKRAVSRLRNGVAPRVGNRIDIQRSRFDTAEAARLHAALIDPLMPHLARITNLVVIPDGVLHHLPFDALVTAHNGSPEYLVARFAIRLAPSLAIVGRSRRRTAGPVVAIAGNVSGVEEELAALGSVVRATELNVLRGLSEAEIAKAARTASIVHFATHAMTNDAQPLFAYLQLPANSVDDGRLYAFEISRMRFHDALIVLSGCDTGAGRIAGSEGVLSLSRAFLRSGATSAVATLWPVGPPTAHFMGAFYAALGTGLDEASALRQAKLQMLRNGYAEPLYWAPFVLVTAR